jgi:predicted ATPase/class 3 adenylate cyclase/DNA-binding CsgD family transcriptional regulator
MNVLPTGTVTFLFTDIQGSTTLWEREPENMAAALLIHNNVLMQVFKSHGGVVFKTVGDAFQAAFSTAPQALRAAIESQQALIFAPWNELGPLKVRMGLHTGQAELDPGGDEYSVSHTKNRAARIMSAARGGQVLLSLATAELLRGHLPSDITLKDIGEHFLKGLLQPEHLFQAFAPDLPADVAALNARPLAQANMLEEVIQLALAERPQGVYDFLESSIYTEQMTAAEQADFLHLLAFVRNLQIKKPIYETVFQHLLYLYVLNGSRLDMLQLIDRRLRGLAESQGALMLIAGVSGIGKTSMAMAFQERVRQLGADFISAHCLGQGSMSYALWQDVTRSASTVTGRPLETLSAPIGKGKEVQSPQQIREELGDWLVKCAAAQPLVILLDDLHWADADSLEVLNYLTSQPVQPPILYIATYRIEETQSRYPLDDFLPKLRRNRKFDHIHLQPLITSDIERLVNAFHGACSPQLAEYLHDRAEGHPLFTVEMLNDLVAQNMLTKDRDDFWLPPEQSIPVPIYLKQLINQRVGRLGDQVEQLLAVGAVAGESWSLKIIEPVVNMSEEELLEALDQALRSEIIIIEDDKSEIYRFSHGLIREVLYTQQLARRRRRIHEQIAAQLEQQLPTNVYTIAYHYNEAENWMKAVDYCLASGEEANRQYANYSALHWFQQALNAVERAGKLLMPAARLTLYERMGRTHLALEQREEAEIIYNRMRDFAQSSGDLIAEANALVNLSNVRWRQYQRDLAEKTAYEALKIAEQTGDLILLANIHSNLAGIAIACGELDQVRYHSDEVLRNAEVLRYSASLLDTLRHIAYNSTWLGRYSEAERYARWALQLSKKSGDPLAIVGAYSNLSFALIESGQYGEAYENIRTILEAVEVSGSHHHQQPRLLNLMGYLFLELGDAQEALTWDQKALEAVRDTHVQSFEMRRYSLLNIATDYLHLGKLGEAQDTIVQFEAIKGGAEFVHFRYFNRYQLLMSEMYLIQSAFGQAIDLAQKARNLAQSKGVLKNIAKSHWLEAQALTSMMRFNEALDHLEEAVGIVDSIQHGSLRWKIRLTMAAVLARIGKSPEEIIGQARSIVDKTIHTLSDFPLQEIFLSSHWIKQLEQLEQHPLAEKQTYPAGLTQREVEVLKLVAMGATNQQVAQALFISIRTVNTHMTNILNKTGCENRTAASKFAIQHHLVST